MKYNVISTVQLIMLGVLIGLISGIVIILNSTWRNHNLTPQVFVRPNGECVKVLNFENGHAFTCPDKDILLRRYRVVTTN
jgi:hypothetical protein